VVAQDFITAEDLGRGRKVERHQPRMCASPLQRVCQVSAAAQTHILAVPAVVLVLGLDVDGELGQEGALQGTAVSWPRGMPIRRAAQSPGHPAPRDTQSQGTRTLRDAHPKGHPAPRHAQPHRTPSSKNADPRGHPSPGDAHPRVPPPAMPGSGEGARGPQATSSPCTLHRYHGTSASRGGIIGWNRGGERER